MLVRVYGWTLVKACYVVVLKKLHCEVKGNLFLFSKTQKERPLLKIYSHHHLQCSNSMLPNPTTIFSH